MRFVAADLLVSDDEDPDSSGSSDNERSSGPYCGLNRNFLQRSGPRVTVVTTRQITREVCLLSVDLSCLWVRPLCRSDIFSILLRVLIFMI